MTELDWWQGHRVQGVDVLMAPAQHFSPRGLGDRNRSLWGSFLLRWNEQQAYCAADSGYASHFRELRRRHGAVDIALLPIGAYEPRWFMREAHMNPAEAVCAHRDLDSRLSLGMHFGTFRLTDEGADDPARALQRPVRPPAWPSRSSASLPSASRSSSRPGASTRHPAPGTRHGHPARTRACIISAYARVSQLRGDGP